MVRPPSRWCSALTRTVERRWGRKIAAKGRYRDPVRSKDDQVVMTPGLQWVSVADAYRVAGRYWALPFLTALVVSARYDRRKGRRHKTVTDYAQQMLVCLRRWLPDRDLVVVADGGYAKREFLRHWYVKADCRRHQTAQGRVPVPACASAAARPDRAAPGGRSAIAQSHGGAGRSRYTMDSLPRHRFRRQYHHGRARFGRPARWYHGGRRAFPYVGSRYLAEGPCFAMHREAEPLRILQWYLLGGTKTLLAEGVERAINPRPVHARGRTDRFRPGFYAVRARARIDKSPAPLVPQDARPSVIFSVRSGPKTWSWFSLPMLCRSPSGRGGSRDSRCRGRNGGE